MLNYRYLWSVNLHCREPPSHTLPICFNSLLAVGKHPSVLPSGRKSSWGKPGGHSSVPSYHLNPVPTAWGSPNFPPPPRLPSPGTSAALPGQAAFPLAASLIIYPLQETSPFADKESGLATLRRTDNVVPGSRGWGKTDYESGTQQVAQTQNEKMRWFNRCYTAGE